MRNKTMALLLAALLWFLPLAAAEAHRMLAEAEPNAYVIRVFFDDGFPAPGAEVVVQSEGRDAVSEGVADGDGLYYFTPPEPAVYQVTVRDNMGHRYSFTLDTREEGAFAAGEAPRTAAETLVRVGAGFGYLAGLAALAWWFVGTRRARPLEERRD